MNNIIRKKYEIKIMTNKYKFIFKNQNQNLNKKKIITKYKNKELAK